MSLNPTLCTKYEVNSNLSVQLVPSSHQLFAAVEATSKVRRLDSLNPRLQKAEVYLSHVLISEKCFYQLYLNKQDKSLCFRRDIRKKYSTLVYTSNAYLFSHTLF